MEAKRRAAGTRTAGVLAALYLAGLVHWALFFGWGQPGFPGMSFTVADWPKEYRYYSVLQQSVRSGRIPYFISRPIQETRKFLSIPETTWSPQVLLLGLVSIETFVVLNTLLLYSTGFLGCLLLRRRFRLSLVPFTFLFLLVAFNGHIAAHLAVGHSMWVGYFLLPAFAALALELARGGEQRAPELALAAVLFAILLQGALHVFVWCLLLLLLVALFTRTVRGRVLRALAWTAPLAALRLAPAAVILLGRREQAFLSGYPSLATVLAGLAAVRPLTEPRRGGAFGDLNWWEYDAYVGPVGLAWLLYFGVYQRFRQGAAPDFRRLEPAMAAMAVLALGDLYAVINVLRIPLLASQRVSSRLLIVPLLFLAVMAAARMEVWLAARGRGWRQAGAAGAAALALSLALHSHSWRVPAVEALWPPAPKPRDLQIEVIGGEGEGSARDDLYVAIVRASALLSLGSLALLARRWAQARPARSGAPEAGAQE